MAYVYRHIRLDKNEPFYIGIGSDNNYKRANEKYDRSKFWKNIYKNGIEVEILMDNLTWEQACEKEKEFILLYGRLDIGTGILCNLTFGGDGTLGVVKSKETILKHSISAKKNVELNKEFFNKIAEKGRNSLKNKEYHRLRRGKPSGYKHTEESKIKISLSKIGLKSSKERLEKISKKVVQKTIEGEIIKIWDSAKQVQRETPFSQANISRCCNGVYSQSYGFKWEYYKQ